MRARFTARGLQIWGARASRVLVSASLRNSLSLRTVCSATEAQGKGRDREDAFASRRDACAPQASET